MVEVLRTVDILRPGAGKRYTGLPVDHVDITGFHTDYDGSPLQPQMLDIRVGDTVYWYDAGVRYRSAVDEVVVDRALLRVAFADAELAPSEW